MKFDDKLPRVYTRGVNRFGLCPSGLVGPEALHPTRLRAGI